MTERFVNAYRQAPWRTQLQWIGILLLVLVGAVIVTGLYLNITAQAAAAGIDVQLMEYKREVTVMDIADKRAELAYLTSAGVMYQRAIEKGYERADMENAIYVVIPGYTGRQFKAITLPSSSLSAPSIVLPAYQESLWDWLFQNRYYKDKTGN